MIGDKRARCHCLKTFSIKCVPSPMMNILIYSLEHTGL